LSKPLNDRVAKVANHNPLSVKLAPPPVLEISGPKLRVALETLIRAVEPAGGIEQFAHALRLKSVAFQQRMGEGRIATLGLADFEQLLATMATVRRRIAKPLQSMGWAAVRGALKNLLDGAQDVATADQRLGAFCAAFPGGKEYRFVRDLAAEVLHNMLPEHYPMMQRWVWDTKSNTGVLREIWHADDVDHIVIDIPDRYETFLTLREELSQFLTSNGVFRDVPWYVDLLQAQIYGEYIGAQGGAFLKTDFSAEVDPLEHSLRILGLDVAGKPGRSRLKTIEGTSLPVNDIKCLN
jgi:hypothetical protein